MPQRGSLLDFWNSASSAALSLASSCARPAAALRDQAIRQDLAVRVSPGGAVAGAAQAAARAAGGAGWQQR